MSDNEPTVSEVTESTPSPAPEDKKVVGKEERELEQKMVKVITKMPANVQDRFKMLHVLSDQRSKINDEYEEEVKKINDRFDEKKKPLLEMRDKIINGELSDLAEYLPKYDEYKAKLDEFMAGVVKDEDDESEKEKEAKTDEEEKVDYSFLKEKKGIPDFWKTCIFNNPMTKQLVQKHDKDILEHLIGFTAEHQVEDSQSKITITMTFDHNEFFKNTSLTYTVVTPEGEEDEVKEVIGCEIEWETGKDVTKKKIKKTQKNKKTNEKRVVYKTVPQKSMFNVFESRKAPEDFDGEDSDEEKIMQGLQDALDFANDTHDMYMGEGIEHYLCPDKSLDALMGQFGEGSDDDDDDDDEEDSKKSKKSKTEKSVSDSSADGKGGKDQKEECKQQ